ncbi:MAG TPA: hypothetical protein VKD90_04920 [Gemmataceae bacterium]|nr:hypothetical protein [Gemmataceae bacterium]
MTAPRFVRWLCALTFLLALSAVARPQPPAERKPNPPLRVGPIDLDLSDPKKPVDPVVFVEPADPDGDAANSAATGLLRRELYRQALLVTVRDELGLTTRDGALREAPPADLPSTNRLRINPRLSLAETHEVKIEVGPTAASRAIWKARAAAPPTGPEDPKHALVTAEVHQRYRQLASIHHPDRGGDGGRMAEIVTAYEEIKRERGCEQNLG